MEEPISQVTGSLSDPVTERGLAEVVFPAFFPKGRLLQFRRLVGGHIHQTMLVEWEQDGQVEQTIFQRLNPHVFPDPEGIAANSLVIASYLESKGYGRDILRAVAMPEGGVVVWHDQLPWRAFPYLSNTYTRFQPVSAEEVYEAAVAIGEWHTFLKDLDPGLIQPAIPGFFDVAGRWAQWLEAKSRALPARITQAAEEMRQLEEDAGLVDLFSQVKKKGVLPLRILHGDPKLSNLLFDEKTHAIRAIIDWDTVQPGWLVFDFGDMVRAYTHPAAEDDPDLGRLQMHVPYLQALTEGFLSQTAHWITPAERENLMQGAQWVIWVQALRFLADYLVGDEYYPVTYPEHNLVRAKNQLQLYRQVKDYSASFFRSK